MAATRSDGCGGRSRTTGRAIAVVRDGKQLRPLGVERLGHIGRHVRDADGTAGSVDNGAACAFGPAIEAIAGKRRCSASGAAEGGVIVDFRGGGRRHARRIAGRILIVVYGDIVLIDLPHGIKRVVATISRRTRAIYISECGTHSVIGGGCACALGPTQEGMTGLGPTRRQRIGGSSKIVIGDSLVGARGGTVGVVGNVVGNFFFNFLITEIVSCWIGRGSKHAASRVLIIVMDGVQEF